MLSWLRVFLVVARVSLSIQQKQSFIAPFATLPATPVLPKSTVSGYVKLPKVSIWQAQFGPPLAQTLKDRCSPILFLHAGLANSNYWAQAVKALLKANVPTTIITIDSRMQGRSTGYEQPLSYDLMREDIIGVLDHFKIPKVTIIGWSDGGILGYEMAIYHPNRLDRLFDFGGSFNPSNGNSTVGDSPVYGQYAERVPVEYRNLSPTPTKYDIVESKVFDMFATQPQLTDADFAKIPTIYQDCVNAPFIWVVDGADEEVVNRDVPTTIHNRIQGSGLLILPSVSHFALLQDPKTMNAAIERFLQVNIYCTKSVRYGIGPLKGQYLGDY